MRLKEIQKCEDSIVYFAKRHFRMRPTGVMYMYKYKADILEGFVNNRVSVINAARQTGKTTLLIAYALWITCFHRDQSVVIMSCSSHCSDVFMRALKEYLACIPDRIRPRAILNTQSQIAFDNGSSISVGCANTKYTSNCDHLLVDEGAFINQTKLMNTWGSIVPTKAKIIIASTPNQSLSFFHELCTQASKNRKYFYRHVKQIDLPRQIRYWKKSTCKILNISADDYDREFDAEFT